MTKECEELIEKAQSFCNEVDAYMKAQDEIEKLPFYAAVRLCRKQQRKENKKC